MKTRESLIAAGLAVGIMAGCAAPEEGQQPDQALMQALPSAVEAHIANTAKVRNEGENIGSAIRIALGSKAMYLTARHVSDNLGACEPGDLEFMESGAQGVEQYLPRTTARTSELAILDAETTGHPKGAPLAAELPQKGDKAYFITYQSDRTGERGPYEEGELQKPATFMGTVVASSVAELRVAVPAADTSLPTDFGGASGAGVFTKDGSVTSIVNKAGLAPTDAAQLEGEYGVQLKAGSYDQLVGVPINDAIVTELATVSTPQKCA